MYRNGNETNMEMIQIKVITAFVRCFVTRTRNGYMIAMNRSQEIAERVSTIVVMLVTVMRGAINSFIIVSPRKPSILVILFACRAHQLGIYEGLCRCKSPNNS